MKNDFVRDMTEAEAVDFLHEKGWRVFHKDRLATLTVSAQLAEYELYPIKLPDIIGIIRQQLANQLAHEILDKADLTYRVDTRGDPYQMPYRRFRTTLCFIKPQYDPGQRILP